jgi:hypothetical protein
MKINSIFFIRKKSLTAYYDCETICRVSGVFGWVPGTKACTRAEHYLVTKWTKRYIQTSACPIPSDLLRPIPLVKNSDRFHLCRQHLLPRKLLLKQLDERNYAESKCRGSHCTRRNYCAILLSSTQVNHSSLQILLERARSNIGLPRKPASFFEVWPNLIWFLSNTLPVDFGWTYAVNDPSKVFCLFKGFMSKSTRGWGKKARLKSHAEATRQSTSSE